MTERRFENLGPLQPSGGVSAPPAISRFEYLEIGDPVLGAAPPVAPPSGRTFCPHCGQANEPARETCWACCRWLTPSAAPLPAAEAPLEIVLDGRSYRSDDPAVPEDIQRLIQRIQKEGYSQKLLGEWRQWRATRKAGLFKEDPAAYADVKLFRGQRVRVLRIDGKTYTSDMKDLPPDVKSLFDYLEKNDVTPELMDHLRRFGTKVKFRPGTTADPSDGEVSFWKAAKELLNG